MPFDKNDTFFNVDEMKVSEGLADNTRIQYQQVTKQVMEFLAENEKVCFSFLQKVQNL